jgi:hypothetical protein
LELALIRAEECGMLQRKEWADGEGTQTLRGPKLIQAIRLGGVQKRKEWVVRKGPRPTRGFKAKKKKKVIVHKLRADMELGIGQECGGHAELVRKKTH